MLGDYDIWFILKQKTRMTTSISSEAQKNYEWEYVQVDLKCIFLKSRIDLLEKINMKPCFILYNDDGQSKLHKRCS